MVFTTQYKTQTTKLIYKHHYFSDQGKNIVLRIMFVKVILSDLEY